MPPAPLHPADAAFLAVLPAVLRHARIQFRSVRCVHERADLIQEAVAYALKWTRLLHRRGKDVRDFPSQLAHYAVLAVKSGRRLCGMAKSKDVYTRAARARFGFTCGALDAHAARAGTPLQDALCDNTRSAVPDQAAFRLDFPAWLETRSPRDRAIIGDMLRSERTLDLARKHRLSAGRVSQLRREYAAHWAAFHGEPA
jgi:hypothetical protein